MPDTIVLSKRIFGLLIFSFGMALGFLIANFIYNRPGLYGNLDVGGPHDFDDQSPSNLQWRPYSSVAGADSNLDAYRKSWAMTNLSVWHARGKPSCIVHDSGSAIAYDTGFFRNFAKYRSPDSTNGKKYIWAMGYYPEICADKMSDQKTRPRLGIFLIPTMRNRDTANFPRDILDYDSLKNTPGIIYYYPDTVRYKMQHGMTTTIPAPPEGIIYDQGTIFP